MAESPRPPDPGTPTNTDMPENSLFLPTELYKQMSRFLERFFDPSPVPVESKVDLSHLMSAIPVQTILDILYIYFCPEGETHPHPPNSSLRAGGTQLGAIVSTLVPYISVAYDMEQLGHVLGRVTKECSGWIREMVSLPDFTGTLFHLDSEVVKEGFAPLLSSLDKELILPICKLAINAFMGKQSISEFAPFMKQNTELTGDKVKFLLRALQEVFYESAKANLNEEDFFESLKIIGVAEAAQDLYSVYQENSPFLRKFLKPGLAMTSYADLRWRVEVQIARKTLLQEAVPKVIMCLTLGTKRNMKKGAEMETTLIQSSDLTDLKQITLQVDPKTLIRITRILEGALREMVSPYCRRVMRHVQ